MSAPLSRDGLESLRVQLEALSSKQLNEACGTRGITKGGTKAVMKERILVHERERTRRQEEASIQVQNQPIISQESPVPAPPVTAHQPATAHHTAPTPAPAQAPAVTNPLASAPVTMEALHAELVALRRQIVFDNGLIQDLQEELVRQGKNLTTVSTKANSIEAERFWPEDRLVSLELQKDYDGIVAIG